MNKDELILEEIVNLVDGLENSNMAISLLLGLTIGVGCKFNKSCADCPLTSYICRQIREKQLMLYDYEMFKNIEQN